MTPERIAELRQVLDHGGIRKFHMEDELRSALVEIEGLQAENARLADERVELCRQSRNNPNAGYVEAK